MHSSIKDKLADLMNISYLETKENERTPKKIKARSWKKKNSEC